MNLKLLILLTLGLVSCGAEIVDTDGLENAAVKVSQSLGENLREALGTGNLKTSTVVRSGLRINGVQKVFEARIDSLKSIQVTISNPRENVGLNGVTGRTLGLGVDRFGKGLSWKDLGLVVVYEKDQLEADLASIKEVRDPRTGVITSVEVTYEVEGNTEDLLEVYIGNDFTGAKLHHIQRVLHAGMKFKIKSKTDLNQNHKGAF